VGTPLSDLDVLRQLRAQGDLLPYVADTTVSPPPEPPAAAGHGGGAASDNDDNNNDDNTFTPLLDLLERFPDLFVLNVLVHLAPIDRTFLAQAGGRVGRRW
jgi:hypothetical protein